MKKARCTFFLLSCLLLTAVIAWAAVDFSGDWSGSLKMSNGQTLPWYMSLKQNGNKVTGNIGQETERRDIQDAKMDGSTLHFRVPGGDGSGTEFITVELQLQNDEIVGTMQGKDRTGQMQTYSLTFTRGKAH